MSALTIIVTIEVVAIVLLLAYAGCLKISTRYYKKAINEFNAAEYNYALANGKYWQEYEEQGTYHLMRGLHYSQLGNRWGFSNEVGI
jgi:hypothetical protein